MGQSKVPLPEILVPRQDTFKSASSGKGAIDLLDLYDTLLSVAVEHDVVASTSITAS